MTTSTTLLTPLPPVAPPLAAAPPPLRSSIAQSVQEESAAEMMGVTGADYDMTETQGSSDLQAAADDQGDNDAVSEMIDATNADHSSLDAFEQEDREERVNLVTGELDGTGEAPERKRGLLGDLSKLLAKQARPEPQNRDVVSELASPDDDDYVPHARTPIDLSNIPDAKTHHVQVPEETRISPRELVAPKYRHPAHYDLSQPRKRARSATHRRSRG